MEKNKKKKFRDIRNAVVMMCVMVAMMSTASYAWFTLTDAPTVTGMQMTAASTGGLKISWKSDDMNSFKNAIDYKDHPSDQDVSTPKTLVPVHPTAAGKFAEGKYDGNTVTGLKANLSDLTNYVAHYTVYLKSESAETETIGIICGDSTANTSTELGVVNDQPKVGGSLVRAKSGGVGDTSTMQAPYAVRVGIVADGTMWIWEPNNDEHNTGDQAVDNVTPVLEATISSTVRGIITAGGNGEANTNISEGLFTIDTGVTKPVDIYIWLEGTDDDCVDQIKTDYLEAQIQFTVVDAVAP